MHGKIPRPQKRSRLDKLGLYTLPQRHEEALKLIDPAPGKRAECEAEINSAIETVEKVKERHKRLPIRKRDLDKAIKSLRAVVSSSFLVQWSKDFVDQAIIESSRTIHRPGATQKSTPRGHTVKRSEAASSTLCGLATDNVRPPSRDADGGRDLA
jgi:hypothetical protein